MNNYQIICNENMLRTFIAWLPELKTTERYYMTLMARRKYCTDLKMADTTIKRIVCKKEDIFNKIKQLEIPYGTYLTKAGVVIPQGALALYINVNPRSMIVAAKNTIKALIELIYDDKQAMEDPSSIILTDALLELVCEDEQVVIDPKSIVSAKALLGSIYKDKQIAKKPKSVALSEIHKARGTKHFVDIDIDTPELTIEETIQRTQKVLNREAFSVIKTRGGVHIIIETKKANTKDWFRGLRDSFVFDVIGDNMVPIPGGYQGGHTPVFVANCSSKNEGV